MDKDKPIRIETVEELKAWIRSLHLTKPAPRWFQWYLNLCEWFRQ